MRRIILIEFKLLTTCRLRQIGPEAKRSERLTTASDLVVQEVHQEYIMGKRICEV